MFVDAIRKAHRFTRPVVISYRRNSGECDAAIGSFVVINSEGWAVTANHIVDLAGKLGKEASEFKAADAERKLIYAEQTLDKRERARRLKALPNYTPATVTRLFRR